jgi:hypothetical protein
MRRGIYAHEISRLFVDLSQIMARYADAIRRMDDPTDASITIDDRSKFRMDGRVMLKMFAALVVFALKSCSLSERFISVPPDDCPRYR